MQFGNLPNRGRGRIFDSLVSGDVFLLAALSEIGKRKSRSRLPNAARPNQIEAKFRPKYAIDLGEFLQHSDRTSRLRSDQNPMIDRGMRLFCDSRSPTYC